ncbi:diguanylate cyclase [Sulfurimonas sp.]|uniref:GGDEF domain-containing response regulator n=1 Tax=Sulfurimonas sp. TaxID=2022749 RepID=UPI003568F5B4
MIDNATVLIVDDMHSNRQILGSSLKSLYNLVYASNGTDALKILSTDSLPDLILLDIEMPDMDGFEVMEKLKLDNKTNDIPVIFVTGHDDIKNEERALLNGAVDYITKPISPIIVKARVKTHLTIKYQRDQLLHRASHDQLTQVYNRHHLVEEGKKFLSKAIRHNESFCVAILDIDFFKSINDTYGHLIGDEVLKSLATLLKQNIRAEDVVARYGGEEFVIVFDKCKIEDGQLKADILRMLIARLNPSDVKITASLGITCVKPELHNEFDDILKEADEALYKAKETGRNKVIVYK